MEDILALKEGDTLIFEQVYNAYNEKLYFYFLKHTRSQLWSEELLQTTFVKLWRYRGGLSVEHTLSAQIFRIAKTALIDLMRQQRQHREFLQSYSSGLLSSDQHTLPVNKDAVHHLHQEMDKLPPVRKKVFMLSRIDGLSHKEISRAKGQPLVSKPAETNRQLPSGQEVASNSLVYHQQPLPQVLQQLEKHFNINITYNAQQLRNIKVTAEFTTSDMPADILENIALLNGLIVERTAEGGFLLKK